MTAERKTPAGATSQVKSREARGVRSGDSSVKGKERKGMSGIIQMTKDWSVLEESPSIMIIINKCYCCHYAPKIIMSLFSFVIMISGTCSI